MRVKRMVRLRFMKVHPSLWLRCGTTEAGPGARLARRDALSGELLRTNFRYFRGLLVTEGSANGFYPQNRGQRGKSRHGRAAYDGVCPGWESNPHDPYGSQDFKS